MSQATQDPRGAAAGVDDDRRPAPGPRRLVRWLAGALVLALLLIAGLLVVVLRGQGGGDEPDASPTAEPSAEPSAEEPRDHGDRLTRDDWEGTAVGVFRTTDAEAVAEYEQWLGREVPLAVDFSARDTWDDISSPGYLFEEWEGSDRRLVLGVAMLPGDVDDVSIQDGAEGDYDEHFRELAENLVEAGQEDAILRIGWEFNLDNWAWSSGDEDAWKEYYRRIVEEMQGVQGADFRYDWNVNNADNRYDAADYYPGDDVVDYIGVDAYDVDGSTYPYPDDCDEACRLEHQQEAWETNTFGGDRGLEFWSEFAREHDKQMSLPEWGVWDRTDDTGGADNPYYIEQMADFMADPDNAVGYQAYFETSNGGGNHRLMEGDFPAAEAVYRERLGG